MPLKDSSRSISKILRAYRKSYEQDAVDDGVREYINTGGEAAFYAV